MPKVLKTEIKFQVQLNEEQRQTTGDIHRYDVNFILGDFGSGKTLTACVAALNLLFKRDNKFDKIIISRPIDFNATGYLKGTASDKLSFHIMPIKQNLYAAYNKEYIDKLFEEGIIQIIPIDYMKGLTFINAITIIDEFEDITYEDFKLILTRLGKDSKLIFTGSKEQINIRESCIPFVEKLKNSGIVGYNVLKSQHRNEDIQKILDYIKNN